MSCGNHVLIEPNGHTVEIEPGETRNLTFVLESIETPSIHDNCVASGSLMVRFNVTILPFPFARQ
jgi:hypothetical protein